MAAFYIDYDNKEVVNNEWVEGDLNYAMRIADIGASYTRRNIVIRNPDGIQVAIRVWHENPCETVDDEIINFGSLGFYDEWRIKLFDENYIKITKARILARFIKESFGKSKPTSDKPKYNSVSDSADDVLLKIPRSKLLS